MVNPLAAAQIEKGEHPLQSSCSSREEDVVCSCSSQLSKTEQGITVLKRIKKDNIKAGIFKSGKDRRIGLFDRNLQYEINTGGEVPIC